MEQSVNHSQQFHSSRHCFALPVSMPSWQGERSCVLCSLPVLGSSRVCGALLSASVCSASEEISVHPACLATKGLATTQLSCHC